MHDTFSPVDEQEPSLFSIAETHATNHLFLAYTTTLPHARESSEIKVEFSEDILMEILRE